MKATAHSEAPEAYYHSVSGHVSLQRREGVEKRSVGRVPPRICSDFSNDDGVGALKGERAAHSPEQPGSCNEPVRHLTPVSGRVHEPRNHEQAAADERERAAKHVGE